MYQSEDLQVIAAVHYIHSIIRQIKSTFPQNETDISVEKKIENVRLSFDKAVPCALIINELVTNSIKYAFINRDSGNIKIHFTSKNSQYELIIADDGIGMQKKVDIQNLESIGIKIV